MTHEEIKKGLREKNLSFSALAKASKKSPETFRGVSLGDITSAPVAKIIATALDKPIQEVFPDNPEYVEKTREEQIADRNRKAKQIVAQVSAA